MLVEAVNLRKRYGDVEALRGVSFHVAAGEIYGLLGPNGAGKSTTVGILCCLLRPDSGDVRLDGIDVLRQPVAARRLLGVVPQDVALYTDLSARDNLRFFGRLYGLRGSDLRDRIERVLQQTSLADRADEPIERYSGGMLRRLNIAAGILHTPRIVLFDEPTVGLDPQTRATILDLIRVIGQQAAVVYTTHYLDEAERLCDRLAIIDRGTLLAEGTLDELRRAAGEREIIALRGTFRPESVPAALVTLGGIQPITSTADELLFTVESAERDLSKLMAIAPAFGEVREVAIKQPSLENLFIKMTGRGLRD